MHLSSFIFFFFPFLLTSVTLFPSAVIFRISQFSLPSFHPFPLSARRVQRSCDSPTRNTKYFGTRHILHQLARAQRVVNPLYPRCCQLATRSAHSVGQPYPISYKVLLSSPAVTAPLSQFNPIGHCSPHPIIAIAVLSPLWRHTCQIGFSLVRDASTFPTPGDTLPNCR